MRPCVSNDACFMKFGILMSDMYTFTLVICTWCTVPFPTHSGIVSSDLLLKSALLDTCIAISACFLVSFLWTLLSILSLSVSVYLCS